MLPVADADQIIAALSETRVIRRLGGQERQLLSDALLEISRAREKASSEVELSRESCIGLLRCIGPGDSLPWVALAAVLFDADHAIREEPFHRCFELVNLDPGVPGWRRSEDRPRRIVAGVPAIGEVAAGSAQHFEPFEEYLVHGPAPDGAEDPALWLLGLERAIVPM